MAATNEQLAFELHEPAPTWVEDLLVKLHEKRPSDELEVAA